MQSVPVLSRRHFIHLSTTGIGGLLICGSLRRGAGDLDAAGVFKPNPLLQIDPDGTVHIWAPRPDVGEGTRTSLPMLVAEELEADWSRVQVHQADLDAPAYGDQDVGGSDSVQSSWIPLRQAGAVARELLKQAAGRQWHVPPAECVARAAVISHPGSGRSASYGALANEASRLTPPTTPPALKNPDEYRLVGQRVPGIDNVAIVTGRPIFGLDVHVPGQLYAAVARAPVDGTLAAFDESGARLVPGVRHVVKIAGLERTTWLRTGIAVVADSTWAAMRGRDALRATWNDRGSAAVDSSRLTLELKQSASQPGTTRRRVGDVDRALERAAHVVDAEYELPLLAHVSMEPLNCTAHVRANHCDVWGPIQMPEGCRADVARATGLPPEAIAIHPTRTGGSFGRRLASDFAAEAAYLSKAVGQPVQVVWTREDDMQHDFYRPAAYHRVRAGLGPDRRIVAWRHRVASLPNSMYPDWLGIDGLLAPRSDNLRDDLKDGLVPGLIGNYLLESSLVPLPIDTGSLRAPGDNANAFVVESVIDELAHAGGIDALELRNTLVGAKADFPYTGSYDAALYNPYRLKGVLALAARNGGWGTPLPSGRGRGIAGHYWNGGYAAHVVEVEVNADRVVKIRRIVVAVDCGIPVNRSGIDAQAQGGTIDALSGALFGEIGLTRGRSQQQNFDTYRWIRNHEVPPIEVHIVESRERPTGLGEVAYPPLASALCTAIFAAAGVRVRRLPVVANGFSI